MVGADKEEGGWESPGGLTKHPREFSMISTTVLISVKET